MNRRLLTIGNLLIAVLAIATVAGTFWLTNHNPVRDAGDWNDATDVLADNAAASAGREAVDPLINTEQGNMLVFFFGLAGGAAGILIGYNWHRLLSQDKQGKPITFQSFPMASAGFLGLIILLAAYEGFSGGFFFDPVMGDVVLFVFALAGALAGSVAGYRYGAYRAHGAGRAEQRG